MELIDREQALNVLDAEAWSFTEYLQKDIGNVFDVHLACFADDVRERLKDMPTVQAVKKGHWIHKNDDVFDWFECSECGYGDEGEVNYGCGMKYCPNCGARMVDDNNDR